MWQPTLTPSASSLYPGESINCPNGFGFERDPILV
ncbi:hypothetical protein CYB_2058 [Synechococcus sp. JA-2-3B'a(2-13)]|nr:hypothetical protein CYB_2058 [Synechococcus sp. JA-2-3B'a(2-13)]